MIGTSTKDGKDYCVLVTDRHTVGLVSSVCRMQDISSKGILRKLCLLFVVLVQTSMLAFW
jgi:hypothetical protein